MSTIPLPLAIAAVIVVVLAILDLFVHVDSYLERRDARRRNQAHPWRNKR